VSEIKRQAPGYPSDEEEEEQKSTVFSAAPLENRPVNLVPQAIDVHSDRTQKKLSPAEKGTLLHSVFQYLDFTSIVSDKNSGRIASAVQQLIEYRMISEDTFPVLETYFDKIDRFAASALCARIVAAEQKKGAGPFREIPFSITANVGESDVSLIQGMIDCWFIENESAVLVDYKSDRIQGTKEDKARILAERYEVQLDYYVKAIEAASGLPVKERIIWLIPDGLSFLISAPRKTQ
jgi:ATP-dependent helicase/nuclease subunit A